jgi:lipid-binding SYLF domain-containing protein
MSTIKAEKAPPQRLSSLSDIRAAMLESSFKELDFEATVVKESNISPHHFQRKSSRSVLSPNSLDGSSLTATSVGSSPRQRLSRSASLSHLPLKSSSSRRFTLTQVEVDPWADASPVLPINDRLSKKLKIMSRRAMKFLLRLQEPPASRTSVSVDPIMPPTALNFSRGLALLRQHKAGLVTSWTWGSGFVIARLGPGLWSAPCFLQEKFLSCGFTCGYRTVDICYAIPTNAGMKHFNGDSFNSAFDLGLTLGHDPMRGETPVVIVQSADRTTGRYALSSVERPKVFSICDGAIMDISWRCGMHLVDEKVNKELYGENVEATDILEGKVQIPAEFKPFYDLLTTIAAVGEVKCTRPTVSMFEKEKNKLKTQPSLLSSRTFPRNKAVKLGSGSSTDSNTYGSESTGCTYRTSMNDSALMGSSYPNSIGSQCSTLSQLPGAVSGVEPSSNHRLFGDTELLDLDLDSLEEEAAEVETNGQEEA